MGHPDEPSASVRVSEKRIDPTSDGFTEIARIFEAARNHRRGDFVIDCSRLTWLGANMCAPLAAVLAGRKPRFRNLSDPIKEILEKNGFLTNRRSDTYGTTMAFHRFSRSERDQFTEYIQSQFRGKGLPKMTPALQRRFRQSIFELFENAVAHSNTDLGIFACGQFFPHRNELHFCITDRGVGIPRRVRDFLALPLSATAAIDWAMRDQNTTRRVTDGLPGGLGLKWIRDFIAINGGAVRVASEDGFWWARGRSVATSTLASPFPGTAVDIEINTADTKSYALASEINAGDIF